jgi:hemolysin activation/secretion protein
MTRMRPVRPVTLARRAWPVAARLVVLAGGLVEAMPAVAQNVDPGAIQREIERQQQRIEQQAAPPKLEGPAVVGPQRPPAVVFPGGGPTLRLKRVIFEGASKFLSRQELDGIVAKYVGTKVDLAALQRMVQEINALYAAKGVVTGNAALPPQTVNAGTVRVKLIEGRLGKLSVEGNVQTAADYIAAHFPMTPGEVVDTPELSREVVWFNRTSDVQVRALLQPGADFGLTDVKLSVIEPARDTLQLFTDNQGVKATGPYETGFFYKRHSLFGIDDRLTFYGVKSDGNLAYNIGYNVPLFLTDGRLGVSFNAGKIRIVEGPLVPLDDRGGSNLTSVNLVQPVFVNESWTLLANAGISYGASDSNISGQPLTDFITTKPGGGFTVTAQGETYSFSVSPNAAEAYSQDRVLDAFRKFPLYTGTTTNLVRLPDAVSLSFVGAWQATPAHLLPGDQLFNIGGPTTVRGYPTNAIAGDSGYYGNLELHRKWGTTGLDTFVFTDFGQIYSTFPVNKSAWSVGLGESWTPFSWITFELSAGFPVLDLVSSQSQFAIYYRVTWRPGPG